MEVYGIGIHLFFLILRNRFKILRNIEFMLSRSWKQFLDGNSLKIVLVSGIYQEGSFLFHFSLFSVPTLLKLGVCSESFLRNFLNSFPRMFCGVWVFIDRQISISFFPASMTVCIMKCAHLISSGMDSRQQM